MKKNTNKSSYTQKAFQLFKDYFIDSDQKLNAWLLLIGIILCVISIVALTALMPWIFMGFWTALMAVELSGFLFYSGAIGLTIAALVGVDTLKDYLTNILSINWRKWLTSKYEEKYFFGKKNYLDVSREAPHIDNPDQRIQKNIKNYIELTLSLSAEFLRSSLSLSIFIGTLWIVGGALTLAILGTNIIIPGYLVWVSLLVALTTSVITHVLGKSLSELNQKEECYEAKFGKDLEFVHNEAENIALEAGEKYHKEVLDKDFENISQNAFQKLWVNLKLNAFRKIYTNLSTLLPYFFAAPAYFAGLIQFSQIMQIGIAFEEVSSALNWFVDSYASLKKYQASVERLIELEEELDTEGSGVSKKDIHVTENPSDELAIKNLSISYPKPSSTYYMIQHLNLAFKPGVNTLIQAPSGYGKSTLFKTLRKTWKYGEGEVSIPQHQKTYFLPQKPLITNDTLKAVLAYPDPVNTYTKEQYIHVLTVIGGKMERYLPDLDKEDTWSKRLSPGQQQRISFARALLKKPDWLFLDEATASLDEISEEHLYHLLKEELPNTTVISIAHRSTVAKFHQRVVSLENASEPQPAVLGR